MDDPVETLCYNDCTIKIFRDPEPESPREWSNLGTLRLRHRKYDLPFEGEEPSEEAVILAVRGYEHGSLSCTAEIDPGYPFNDRWDSGLLGIIFAEPNTILDHFGASELTEEIRAKAIEAMIEEVKQFNQYLQGECWGYFVEGPGGEETCCGYYDMASCREDAKNAASQINPQLRLPALEA